MYSFSNIHKFTSTLATITAVLKVLIWSISVSDHQRGLLYQGLHNSGSMVTMGKAGLLGHNMGGYSLPSPISPGLSLRENGARLFFKLFFKENKGF